ncbi:hypothetical protein CDAR_391851 [Caerostris darwini]|uniref:Uncharacterized protein n=1 Tax=Caerostris darwini TaxID=1538125 RepID=A0AAV4RYB8_9ARAC|nr:hypothetical protein CDAR_391851 [Caerostris darwini]
MGGRAFLFLLWSIPASAAMPHAQSTAQPDDLMPDEEVRVLSESGNVVTAVLQLIENIAHHQNASCRRVSLEQFVKQGFDWRQSTKFAIFEKQMKAAVKTANILNHYFFKSPNDTEVIMKI